MLSKFNRRLLQVVRPLPAASSNVLMCMEKEKNYSTYTISVEGNIASGKTYFLDFFRSAFDCKVYPEPVDKWRNIRGHNALELMYRDPGRWSMTLQTYIQLTMLQNHLEIDADTVSERSDHMFSADIFQQDQPFKMMERSIHSARYCFVENHKRSGLMAPIDYIILSQWYDFIVKNMNSCRVDLIIYLRADPETVYERIRARCRKEELAIPLSYLQALHNLYEEWLIKKTQSDWLVPDRLIVIDANKGKNELADVYKKHSNTILPEQVLNAWSSRFKFGNKIC